MTRLEVDAPAILAAEGIVASERMGGAERSLSPCIQSESPDVQRLVLALASLVDRVVRDASGFTGETPADYLRRTASLAAAEAPHRGWGTTPPRPRPEDRWAYGRSLPAENSGSALGGRHA